MSILTSARCAQAAAAVVARCSETSPKHHHHSSASSSSKHHAGGGGKHMVTFSSTQNLTRCGYCGEDFSKLVKQVASGEGDGS